MPEPFAQPRMRTGFPPMMHLAAAHFGTVSVVMMARATCSKALASESSARARAGTACENFFDAQWRADHSGGADENFARRHSRAREPLRRRWNEMRREPSGPVQQFALPELTMTARTFPRDSFEVLLADANWGGLHAVRGEDGRGVGGRFADDEREVEPRFLQAAMRGGEREAVRNVRVRERRAHAE